MPTHRKLVMLGIALALLIGGVYFVTTKRPATAPVGPDTTGNSTSSVSTERVATGYLESGFEGYFSRFNYSFPYDPAKFAVATSSNNSPAIRIDELGTSRSHTVRFMYNGAAGFASSQEAWEARPECATCTKTTSPVSIAGAKDLIAYENANELWIVFEQYPGYVIIGLDKPAAEALKIISKFAVYGEDVQAPDKSPVTLYFFNERIISMDDCDEVVPVTRLVPKTTAVATEALRELLKGPTEAEKAQGFTSVIPAGSKLNSLNLVNGEARADFNAATESGGGSCSMSARVAEIRSTLLAFPTIKTVTLSIDGRTGDIFQP